MKLSRDARRDNLFNRFFLSVPALQLLICMQLPNVWPNKLNSLASRQTRSWMAFTELGTVCVCGWSHHSVCGPLETPALKDWFDWKQKNDAAGNQSELNFRKLLMAFHFIHKDAFSKAFLTSSYIWIEFATHTSSMIAENRIWREKKILGGSSSRLKSLSSLNAIG